jgi:putative photosynthetic complex assembly protein
MHAPHSPETIPRKLILAMFGLAFISLLAAATVRIVGMPIHSPDSATTQVRQLRFEDVADGSIKIIDATSNQLVLIYSAEGGFLRGAVRALARERRRIGLGADLPFHLIARSDGRLTLFDPSTKQRIDLEAFGPTNSNVFAALLSAPIAAQ